MKIRFTEKEVKEAIAFYIEHEDGLNVRTEFFPNIDVSLSFLDYKDERVMVSEVEMNLVEGKKEDEVLV